jgi:hypothetical protein
MLLIMGNVNLPPKTGPWDYRIGAENKWGEVGMMKKKGWRAAY